jgi:hypothetical protein
MVLLFVELRAYRTVHVLSNCKPMAWSGNGHTLRVLQKAPSKNITKIL